MIPIPREPYRLTRWCIVAVFLVAFVGRAGWGIVSLTRAPSAAALEFPDEVQYWEMGRSLRAGDGLRDELGYRATRMPLYPALLAAMPEAPAGIVLAKALQWIVGAAAAVMFAGLAGVLFDRRTAWLAGLAAALDPFGIFFASLLLTETLFLLAAGALWWWAAHTMLGCTREPATGRMAILGVLAAAAIHVRESTLGLVVLLFALILVPAGARRARWKGAAVGLGIVVLALLPWTARNRAVIGEWCWTTTRFGISLYDGVGPAASGASDLGDVKAADAVAGLPEREWNAWFVAESKKAIFADPVRIVRLGFVKLTRMWNPLPNVETYQSRIVRAISALWTIPVFALAAAGAILWPMQWGRRGIMIVALLLLPALYLSLLHSVFVGSVRYRLGAMPMLEVLAASVAARLLGGLMNRKPGEHSVRPAPD
jgi:hypothetical protein